MGIDESFYAVAILIIAECVYIRASFSYRNPVFAAIYIWVLFAIRDFNYDKDDIQSTTGVLLAVHIPYTIGLTIWLLLDKINNSPNEKTGLFY